MAGDKFMSEFYLRQPGFTYSACGPFTKHQERNWKFKKTGNLKYIWKIELDKACSLHDASYFDGKELAKRTFLNRNLKDKAYKTDVNPKYSEYKKGLATMVYKLFW